MEENRVFSEREMMELAANMQPFLDRLYELKEEQDISGYVSVFMLADGLILVDGEGLNGWRLTREPNGGYTINYSYTKRYKEGTKDEQSDSDRQVD